MQKKLNIYSGSFKVTKKGVTINLPKGRKLVNVTWKETEIWYLTRPMDTSDVAETYQFHEESSWGMVEGTYNIVETK